MEPARRLTREAVEAANRLHERLPVWRLVDRTLDALRQSRPDFGPESMLLKAVAINTLYGTNVLAIIRVADHVRGVLAGADLERSGPELVEEMAAVPVGGAEKRPVKRRSFASKFAHFFINPQRFPILDSYADRMVRWHLGDPLTTVDGRPYEAFVQRYERLVRAVGLAGERRQLDRYLWIAGLYEMWVKGQRGMINAEVAAAFQRGDPELAVLGRCLPRLRLVPVAATAPAAESGETPTSKRAVT